MSATDPGQQWEVRLVFAPGTQPLERVLAIARIRQIPVIALRYVAATRSRAGELCMLVAAPAERPIDHSVRYLQRAVGVTSVRAEPVVDD